MSDQVQDKNKISNLGELTRVSLLRPCTLYPCYFTWRLGRQKNLPCQVYQVDTMYNRLATESHQAQGRCQGPFLMDIEASF